VGAGVSDAQPEVHGSWSAIWFFLHDDREHNCARRPESRVPFRGTNPAAHLHGRTSRGITKEDHDSMHTGSTSVLKFASRIQACGCATVVRVGVVAAIAGAPAADALAQGTQAPPNNQQRQTEGLRKPTPGRLIIPITGRLGAVATPTAAEGEADSTPSVTGSFSIQRFARTTEGAVAAVGTLTLSFTDPTSNAGRTIVTEVAMPLAKAAPGDRDNQPQPIGATPQASLSITPQACETLSLVLGSIELDLLGQAVQLDQVNVDFAATMKGASAQLGTLLCDVTDLMERAAPPAELVQTLNRLLDTIG
jgi:hypothetical protein